MIGSTRAIRVFVRAVPTDLRKGFDGLYGLVCNEMGQDPLRGDLYLFMNARRTSASCARTISTDRASPRRSVMLVEPTMSVNIMARRAESIATLFASPPGSGSDTLPRNAWTAERSTSITSFATSP